MCRSLFPPLARIWHPTAHGPNPVPPPPPSILSQDGTLVLPTTSLPYITGPTDWRFFNGTVRDRLAALIEDGYEVCVIR